MSKQRKDWYSIKALADRHAEIHIFEQIGEDWWTGEGMTAKKFVKELKALDVDTIDLHINSPGGSVFDGQAIYSLLKAHKATIDVYIDGIAASIASVIAMAGDTITMPENALMMIHDPSGVTMGTAVDMRKTADILDKVKTGIVVAYRDKTGLDDDTLEKMMSDETWMTGAEAVALGFADAQVEPVNIQANFDGLGRFKNIPSQLYTGKIPAALGKIPAAQQPNAEEVIDMAEKKMNAPEITLDLIRAEYPDIVTALITDAADTARKEGAEAECKRIQDVRAQLIPGHEALINTLAFDGKTTGPEAAVQVVNAERAAREIKLVQLKADGKGQQVVEPPTGAIAKGTGTVEEQAQAAWDKDDKVRAEFNDNFKSYFAFFKADLNKSREA